MNLQRISVKYFVSEPARVALDALVPVFHEWIQQSKVPGMLIDVADYRHIAGGPGVVLVGHDVDYALDAADGRLGLLHTSKRCPAGDGDARLATAFHAALTACLRLEQEPRLKTGIHFRTDTAKLILPDRLHAPNDASTFDALHREFERFLESLYDDVPVRIERDPEDARRCLTVRITAAGTPSLEQLIARAAERAAPTA